MDNKKVLVLINHNLTLRNAFMGFLREIDLDPISFSDITTFGEKTIVEQVDIGAVIVDVRLATDEDTTDVSSLTLIRKFLAKKTPVIILTNSDPDMRVVFSSEISKGLPISFIQLRNKEWEQKLLLNLSSLEFSKEWLAILAGDSTTDAPPPEKKKKGKGK